MPVTDPTNGSNKRDVLMWKEKKETSICGHKLPVHAKWDLYTTCTNALCIRPPWHNAGAKETLKSFARLASAGVPSRAPSSGVLSRTPSSAVSSVAAQSPDVSTSGDSTRGDLRPPSAHTTHVRRESSRLRGELYAHLASPEGGLVMPVNRVKRPPRKSGKRPAN
jgi:hypothetical protein